jgi:hypothetical protein
LSDADLSAVLFQSYTTLPIFKTAALPVSILSFKGNWKDSKVTLQWEVDQESNINRYEIERSKDGTGFEKIGTLSAVNATSKHDYSYNDEFLLLPLYYYRLKIVDNDGTAKYSGVVLLRKNQPPRAIQIKVMPNPINSWFNIAFESKISGMVTTRLVDLNGKEVWKEEKQAVDADVLNFSLKNISLTPGMYVMQVVARGEETFTKVIVSR